jgi:ABC-2 type transport system permease protein
MMLLSGFAFPVANMPEAVQWLTKVNPICYFLVIVRAIFLKGVGVDILWRQMLPLFLTGFAVLWAAVHRFHKTL